MEANPAGDRDNDLGLSQSRNIWGFFRVAGVEWRTESRIRGTTAFHNHNICYQRLR